MVNENKELKLKVENLNKILTNFTNGKKNLDNLLGNRRCVFDKAGIGYNPKVKEKYYKKFFINENFLKFPICEHREKLGHNFHTCPTMPRNPRNVVRDIFPRVWRASTKFDQV